MALINPRGLNRFQQPYTHGALTGSCILFDQTLKHDMNKERKQIVILDTIREGLVVGYLDPGIQEQGKPWIAIIFWEAIESFLPTIMICNHDHPVQWIEDGAYSVTVYDPLPDNPTSFTPRQLEIYGWAQPREGADPYMIRFAFDEVTGTYYLKQRLERG